MKFTVIGQWGAYPKAGEATAGYLLEHGQERILIDCGSGVLSCLQKYAKLDQLTAAIITHTHHDHIADFGCLQYACLIDTDLQIRTADLPVYIARDPKPAEQGGYASMKGTAVRAVSAADTLRFGDMELSFFQTFHEVYCLAVKVKVGGQVLVYTADTYYDDSLIEFCRGADVLIAEASFYAGFDQARKYGHMNAHEAGRLAEQASVKKLALTHLPHFGDVSRLPVEAGEMYRGEIVLAAQGTVFTFAAEG